MNLSVLKEKTDAIESPPLGLEENPYSTNKVTGYSLNFPITGTCNPTKVCAKTCYFASGPSTWSAALAKQKRLQARLDADPDGLADQIAAWAVRLRLSFVRWHGGGDMTANSARCINRAAAIMPSVPQWVVTRKPALAVDIAPAENVYVHLSIDRSSGSRLIAFMMDSNPALQWFWSYQADKGESPPIGVAPVVFRDHYKPMRGEKREPGDCPLNWMDDITGGCGRCRMCFNGDAVEFARRLVGLQKPNRN